MRSENGLAQVIAEISDAIRNATWGRSDWEAVCQGFTQHFPGSYCSLLNQSTARPEFGFQVSDGLDPIHLHTFLTHYAFVNPWQNFWRHAASGQILVAERDAPASRYKDGEFYNDWMRKTGDFDAAVGMRIGNDAGELIYLPVHYSQRLADVYDGELERVMAGIRPAMIEAVTLKQQLRDMGEHHAARAALIDRFDKIAFVVDEGMQLRDANAAALDAFQQGRMVSCLGRRVRLASSADQDRLERICRALITHRQEIPSQFPLRHDESPAVVSVSRLPDVVCGGLLSVRPLFLVQIRPPRHAALRPNADLLSLLYGLTPREADLCGGLVSGSSLREICIENGISYETGRSRLKTIFAKTGTHSQADLRLLLVETAIEARARR